MADYLLFTLYSPMSSWGEIAVGEVRSSKTHPGRSAIFGLIAASLGIKRDDSLSVKNLHDNFGLGVKVISIGSLLKDFHTVQAARSKKNVVFRTRTDEMRQGQEDIGTIISTREYRSDAMYIIALWIKRDNPKYSLQQIKDALGAPVYVPYLGRKSCPPACNFAPEIIMKKTTLKEAFEQYAIRPVWVCYDSENMSKYEEYVFSKESVIYYWDECENSGFDSMLSTERYDTVMNAERRQFSSRREHMAVVKKGEGE